MIYNNVLNKAEGVSIALRLFEKFGEQGVQLLEAIQKENNPELVDLLAEAMEDAKDLEELREVIYGNRN